MSSDALDPELTLKATPPRTPRHLIARGRLALEHPRRHDKRMLMLQAPAGYGKTALLLQWRREALQQGSLFLWLALDGRDEPELAGCSDTERRRGSGLARPRAPRSGSARDGAPDRVAGTGLTAFEPGPAGTRRDPRGLTALRAAGCDHAFADVASRVARYLQALSAAV
jgi:hypothetical protein